MSLGQYIAQRRQRMNMTQEEFAKLIYVSKSAVAKWETDRGIPDRENLSKLAEVFKTSIDELQNLGRGINQESEVKYPNITREIIELLEMHGYEVRKK